MQKHDPYSQGKLIVNDQIYLRRLLLSDTHAVFNIINSQRAYLGKWLPFVKSTLKTEDTEHFIKTTIISAQEQNEFVFSIIYKNNLVGVIGVRKISKANRIAEIGYWISQDFQKKGIVSRSVTALCHHSFYELGYNRIQIKCAIKNEPSKKVPQRLGFCFEGVERDGELLSPDNYIDLEIYSMLKKEFYLNT